jgi:CO dehydrogenase nickel-insertion accessory protein CooC1
VVQLQTNFGGGKTHSMLALYHLFSGTPPGELLGIDDLLREIGVDKLPSPVRRVALVGNKIRDEREHAAVDEFAASHGLELAAMIPFDERLPEAERAQAAPLDHAPDGRAVEAIGQLAKKLTS